MSASALSQRRAQIPAKAFRDIFMGFNEECFDSETFHGFRILAVDGTAASIPHNPRADSFVVHSGAPKGYNQLHMTPLYDIQIYKKIFCFWNCINYGIIIFKWNLNKTTISRCFMLSSVFLSTYPFSMTAIRIMRSGKRPFDASIIISNLSEKNDTRRAPVKYTCPIHDRKFVGRHKFFVTLSSGEFKILILHCFYMRFFCKILNHFLRY